MQACIFSLSLAIRLLLRLIMLIGVSADSFALGEMLSAGGDRTRFLEIGLETSDSWHESRTGC